MAQSAAAAAGYPADWVAYGQGGFAPPGMFQAQDPQPGTSSGLAPPGTTVSLAGDTRENQTTSLAAPPPGQQSAAAAAGYPADWVPYGNGGFAPPGHPAVTAGATGAPAAAPAGTGGGGGVTDGGLKGPTTPPATPTTVQQAFRNSIQQTLGGQTPDEYAAGAANGPEANAYRTTAQRSAERQQRQAAHLNAIQGGNANSPQLAMASRGIEQNRGEDEASFVGGLVSQRLEAKRGELMQAWQIAAGMGDNAEQRALEREIANMNAAIERSRVDVSREQVGVDSARNQTTRDLGFADIGLRGELGRGDLDLRRYGIDTGRETALDELGLGYSNLSYAERRDRDDRIARGLE